MDTTFINNLSRYLALPETRAQFNVMAAEEFAPGVIGVESIAQTWREDVYFDTTRWKLQYPVSVGVEELTLPGTKIAVLRGIGWAEAPKDLKALRQKAMGALQAVGQDDWYPVPEEIALTIITGAERLVDGVTEESAPAKRRSNISRRLLRWIRDAISS